MKNYNPLCLSTAIAGSLATIFSSFVVPVFLLDVRVSRDALTSVDAFPAIVAGAGVPDVTATRGPIGHLVVEGSDTS